MIGEKDLNILLKNMKPTLNVGDYVFCTLANISSLNLEDIILFFKEDEGYTIILKKEIADQLQIDYTFVAAWITLRVHSSLEGVGLTAAFSDALAQANISCNVVAGYFHDHIFVAKNDAQQAMSVLNNFS
jgi:hypothetical protein